MDMTQIITIGAIVIANIGTTIGLFTWATNHASADAKEGRELIEKHSKESREMINNSRAETRVILEAIQTEMRDFHTRLCLIEERSSTKLVR